jgi:cytochrome c556
MHAGIVSIGAALVAGGLFFTAGMSAAQSPADIVKDRQDVMKQNGDDMKVIAGFVQAGAGTLEDVSAAAGRIAQNAANIPSLFPEGTSMDDVTDPENGAKPVIWEKWDDFVGASDTLEEQALLMREWADNGDADAVTAQLDILGSEGCGGCHKTFRQKLD